MQAIRLPANPIITPASHPSLTERGHGNINGPSIIRVPDWVPNPLGRYYLYFGHHQGTFIRLAFADNIEGPWHIHAPGTLKLDQTKFEHHIASPDVHVDHNRQRIVMYYHGCDYDLKPGISWYQFTCVACSEDGLHFESRHEALCESYLRMFRWRGRHFGVVMPGQFVRSGDGLTQFETRPKTIVEALCRPNQYSEDKVEGKYKPRHFAVHVDGDTLHLFFSRTGDCPEHLMTASVMLNENWTTWEPSFPQSLLRSEFSWEGADEPVSRSRFGAKHHPVHQLRDPAIFRDADDQLYLAYSIAGESGIALARLML